MYCITSTPLKPRETDLIYLKYFVLSKTGAKRNTAAFSQKLYLKGGMQRNEEEETAAAIEREKESGGLELDEGHISSH